MRVAFTCNVCGHRTTRAINPHAYTDGTVFVQVRIYELLYFLPPSALYNGGSFCFEKDHVNYLISDRAVRVHELKFGQLVVCVDNDLRFAWKLWTIL